MWYVIQTKAGREEAVKQRAEKMLPQNAFRECKVLYCISKKRYLGEWHEEREQFLPGYVFLITDDFGEASQLFQEIAEFVRLLGYGKEAPRRERGGKALRKACRGMG